MKIEPGGRYLLTADVSALCCGTVLRRGEAWKVARQPSPNRLLVGRETTEGETFHCVKRSAFSAATEPAP